MKFCPKCEVKLRRGIDGLSCSKCGYAEGQSAQQPQSDDSGGFDVDGSDADATKTMTTATTVPSSSSSFDNGAGTTAAAAADSSSAPSQEDAAETSDSDVLEVFDDSVEDTRPTIKIECEKCGNDEAVWWMLQTRSADEPTTQFYRCTKCQYTWRDYS